MAIEVRDLRKSYGELEAVRGISFSVRSGEKKGPFDCVLWAIGRAPAVENLGLEEAGVKLGAYGFITTDKYQATSADGVFAIGDVTGRAQLTPVATAAGRRLCARSSAQARGWGVAAHQCRGG